jgi:hypothetical protein
MPEINQNIVTLNTVKVVVLLGAALSLLAKPSGSVDPQTQVDCFRAL